MDPTISCCGVRCNQCEYHPLDCPGCSQAQGRVFWLTYTGESVCAIYHCCVGERGLSHCGHCQALPCPRYEGEDPTKSHEENAASLSQQLDLLRQMAQTDPKEEPYERSL